VACRQLIKAETVSLQSYSTQTSTVNCSIHVTLATGWMAGFQFPAGVGILSLSHRVQTGSWTTQWVLGTPSSGVRWPGRGAIPPLTRTLLWHGTYLSTGLIVPLPFPSVTRSFQFSLFLKP